MNGLFGWFYHNTDVFNALVLNHMGDRSSLLLVSRAMNQATRCEEEKSVYLKLRTLIRSMLEGRALSELQRSALQKLSSQIQDVHTVCELPIRGRDVVDRVKRLFAVVVSWNLRAFPVSPGESLASEIRDAASAYRAFSKWLLGGGSHLRADFDGRLSSLPGHYVQYVLDRCSMKGAQISSIAECLKGGDGAGGRPPRWNKVRAVVVSLLSHIHSLLCRNSEMARLVCRKTRAFLDECPPERGLERIDTWDERDAYPYVDLYGMLRAHEGMAAYVGFINKLKSSVRHEHSVVFLYIASSDGDFTGAFDLLEQLVPPEDQPSKDFLLRAIYSNAVKQRAWSFMVQILRRACSTWDATSSNGYWNHAIEAARDGQHRYAVQIAECVATDLGMGPGVRDRALAHIVEEVSKHNASRDDLLAILRLISNPSIRSSGFESGLSGVSWSAVWGKADFLSTRNRDNLQEMVDEFVPYVEEWPGNRARDDIWLEVIERLRRCGMSLELAIAFRRLISD